MSKKKKVRILNKMLTILTEIKASLDSRAVRAHEHDDCNGSYDPDYTAEIPATLMINRGRFLINNSHKTGQKISSSGYNYPQFPVRNSELLFNRLYELLCEIGKQDRAALKIDFTILTECADVPVHIVYRPSLQSQSSNLSIPAIFLEIKDAISNSHFVARELSATEINSIAYIVLGYLSILTDSCSVSLYKHGNDEFVKFVKSPCVLPSTVDCNFDGYTIIFNNVYVTELPTEKISGATERILNFELDFVSIEDGKLV